MVTIKDIEKGIAEYMDTAFMPQLKETGLQKVLIGTGASLFIKRLGTIIGELKNNKIIATLGIFDKDGNVDIDTLAEELKKNMPDEGVVVDLGMLKMTLHESDIEEAYKCIVKKPVSPIKD